LLLFLDTILFSFHAVGKQGDESEGDENPLLLVIMVVPWRDEETD